MDIKFSKVALCLDKITNMEGVSQGACHFNPTELDKYDLGSGRLGRDMTSDTSGSSRTGGPNED